MRDNWRFLRSLRAWRRLPIHFLMMLERRVRWHWRRLEMDAEIVVRDGLVEINDRLGRLLRKGDDNGMAEEHLPTLCVVSGVERQTLPVVQEFIDWARRHGYSVRVIEARKGHRLQFLAKTLWMIRRTPSSTVIYVNTQATVVLLATQIIGLKTQRSVYWALEAVAMPRFLSPLWFAVYAERSLRRSEVDLIVPVKERAVFYGEGYKAITVIENAPRSGRPFIRRRLAKERPIELVYFGGFVGRRTYLRNWIDMVSTNDKLFRLTIIGPVSYQELPSRLPKNINIIGRVSHQELDELLIGPFDYSIVGYEPVDFNNKYCAPNKLLESLSFSLPVVAHSGNPTLEGFVNERKIGVLADFGKLNPSKLYTSMVASCDECNEAAYTAYRETFNGDRVFAKFPL